MRKIPNRIPIPHDLSPTGFSCVRINLPDDAEWKAMFWGALDQLQLWSSYARDVDHNGRQIANIWENIFNDARQSDCASPETGCGYDFHVSPNPWVIYGPYGHYTGSEFATDNFGGPPPTAYSLIVYVTFGVSSHVTHVRLKVTFNLGGNDVYALYTFSGSTLVLIAPITAAFGGTEIIDIYVNLSLLTFVVNLSGNYPGSAVLHEVTLFFDDGSSCPA